MGLLATVLVCFLMTSSTASAEMERIAIPTDQGMSLHWWPKLFPVPGWHHEREQSLQLGVNALAPDGATCEDADTVMYAKAAYKPREPDTKSLDVFIEKDKKAFLARSSAVVIKEATFLTTADGKRLRSFTFFPTGTGNWERVAYGEEGEFYLVFAMSSRSLNGYKAALKAYEQLVGRYKEKP